MCKVVVIGAGGHGKVVADVILSAGMELLGFLDDGRSPGDLVLGYPVLGGLNDIGQYADQGCRFIIAIGSNSTRRAIASAHKVRYCTAIHPSAVIGAGVTIGEGTVVMAGAVVNPDASVGRHCILNTSCVVEHDNRLADYVHICPKAALAGTVTVGEATQIGIGSSVSNNISICAECLLGAGTVAVRDITVPGVYVGAPARLLRSRS
ncbi:acetyltransferase [bacterium]|nr:acetyltransferase [bacterium]